ncbi:MAG: hypothetical protein WC130_04990 [Kiritimatiellia bacterium]
MSEHDFIACRKCTIVKARDEFHVDMQRLTGRSLYCKECRKTHEGAAAKARAKARRNSVREERLEVAGIETPAPRAARVYAPFTIASIEHAYA